MDLQNTRVDPKAQVLGRKRRRCPCPHLFQENLPGSNCNIYGLTSSIITVETDVFYSLKPGLQKVATVRRRGPVPPVLLPQSLWTFL